MSFASINFVIFFAIVFAISLFAKRSKFFKYFLVLASFIFYGFFDIRFVLFLIITILINFIFLKVLNRNRIILGIAIFINLFTLGIFKYTFFSLNLLNQILNELNLSPLDYNFSLIVPVGISFITFRNISILIDSYRGKEKPTDFVEFAAYISFFPQITVGPIARYKSFVDDLKNTFQYNRTEVFLLISSGVFKKIILSSYLFNFLQDPFKLPQTFSSIDLIIALLGYGAYIYLDFSGYTDISNGLSNLLGFKSTKNFNLPLGSGSIITFWKRWHISLSEWLKDYVYIPLGGGKGSKYRKYINLFITMLVGGIWHGAGINFLIWGAFQGIILSISHFISDRTSKSSRIFSQLGKNLNLVIFVIGLNLSWILFNVKSFEILKLYFKNLFKTESLLDLQLFDLRFLIIVFGVYLVNIFGQSAYKPIFSTINNSHPILKIIIMTLIVYALYKLLPSEVPPFVYFNF